MRPFLILLLFAAAGFSKEPAKQGSPTITALEQDIMETALASIYETKGSKSILLEGNATVRPLAWSDPKTYDKLSSQLREEAQDRDAAFREAVEDFIAKNRTETELRFPKPLPKNLEIVPRVRIQKIFAVSSDKKPNGWDIFYARFPHSGGLVMISRPGVDAKHTIAILYMGEQSQYLAGGGQFYIFKFDWKKCVLADDFFGPSWMS